MSELITLDQAKDHCRVLHDFENKYLKSLINAAVKSVSNYLDRPFDGSDPKPFMLDINSNLPAHPLKLQPDIEIGVLMIVDDLYNNRGAKKSNGLIENEAVKFMIQPYRRMGV